MPSINRNATDTTRQQFAVRLRLIVVLASLLLASLLSAVNSVAQSGSGAASGRYYNVEGKFGFDLDVKLGKAVATVSNSLRYHVGQVMLRFQMTGPSEFVGQQLFTDGAFHEIGGRFLEDGSIAMWSRESGPTANFRWRMLPAEATTAAASPPGAGFGAMPNDEGLCNLQHANPGSMEAGDRIIAACTRLIDAANASGGTILAEWYFVRGGMHYSWTAQPDLSASIADLTEAIRLKPDFAMALYMKGVALMASHEPQSAIAVFNRAIAVAERLPATDPTRNFIVGQTELARAAAFAKTGNKDKAVQDYEDCTSRFAETCQQIGGQLDPDLAAAVSERANANRPGLSYDGADRTFVCKFTGAREPWIITISSRRQAFRAEFTTNTYHTRCTVEWVEGRRGTTLVKSEGFGPGCALLADPADDQQQHVRFSGTSVVASLAVNGRTTGGMSFDFATKIARSSMGPVAECHDAGR